MTYLEIATKLLFGLIALLIVTRFFGKKTIAQLTPFDFIHSIVLGGLLEESVYDTKVSPFQLLFAVSVWSLMLYTIEVLSRKHDKVRILLKGEASILIKDGFLNVQELNRNHIEMEQLRIMLRQEGVFSIREVKDLYLEPGGTISLKKYAKLDQVTPKMLNLDPPDEPMNFLFIDEGKINEQILDYVGKTKEWLVEEIRKRGYREVDDVLFAEWTEGDGFYIRSYQENQHEGPVPVKGN